MIVPHLALEAIERELPQMARRLGFATLIDAAKAAEAQAKGIGPDA